MIWLIFAVSLLHVSFFPICRMCRTIYCLLTPPGELSVESEIYRDRRVDGSLLRLSMDIEESQHRWIALPCGAVMIKSLKIGQEGSRWDGSTGYPARSFYAAMGHVSRHLLINRVRIIGWTRVFCSRGLQWHSRDVPSIKTCKLNASMLGEVGSLSPVC